jgi:high-affinity nickel-transport protein
MSSGFLNLVILVGIVRVFRRLRAGTFDEADLDSQLDKRGLLNRLLSGATKAVTRPWQMYPIGVLFGLGFDTATEVGLLVLRAGPQPSACPGTQSSRFRSCSRPG